MRKIANNYTNPTYTQCYMKKILLIPIFSFCCLLTQAQADKYEFGKIAKEDINYKECPFDKTAGAVVLFDKGDSRFVRTENSFQVLYERVTRIKILSNAGIEWAKVEIPFYQSNNIFEKVIELKATAYNFEDGQLKQTKLEKESVHEEKLNENWLLKKFAIPDVKVGTVIEYTYKIESQYVFNLRDWEFQWKIPVLFSQYKVSLVPFYQYTFLLQGASKFDEQTSVVSTGLEEQFGAIKYKDMIHTYIMKNVPAFKDEEFITSPEDYMIKLDFQLSKIIHPDGFQKDIITTWPLLMKDLSEDDNFGRYVDKCYRQAPKVFDLRSIASLSQQQKFDTVINYVKKNYSWNGKTSKYSSKSVKDLMTDKFGNSADINLFAVGLLNGVGVKASPVLISTRSNGKIKYDYPFLDFFNYVGIKANIDSISVLSDATDILIANDRLPVNCLNDRGLIINDNKGENKGKVEWVSLYSRTTSKSRSSIFVHLNDSASTVGVISTFGEYDGLYMRKKYGTDMKNISKYFADNDYNVPDSTVVIKNMENSSNPYSIRFTSEFSPERIGDKIYLAPFFKEVPQINPLKQQQRTYPIDMTYAKQRIFNSNIPIPKGYKVEFLPLPKRIKNQQFEMDYSATVVGENVNVAFYYYFKQPVYEAIEYAKIKAYYNELISKANEKIVFVKE